MGPLATLFANIKARNDAAQRQAGFSGSPESQRLFNSRLSPVFESMNTGRAAPDPRGESISLEGRPPVIDWKDPIGSAFAPSRGPQGSIPFRDQQQGPEPPVDPRVLERLFGGT